MNQIVPQFPKYIADRKPEPGMQILFYANSASKFIRFSNVRNANPFKLKIQLVLDDLQL